MMSNSFTTREQRYHVGVDVGGTTVSTLLLDGAWAPVAELTVATDVSSPDNTLRGIAAAVDQTLAAGHVAPHRSPPPALACRAKSTPPTASLDWR